MKSLLGFVLAASGLLCAGTAPPAIVGSWDLSAVDEHGMQTFWTLLVNQNAERVVVELRSKGDGAVLPGLAPKIDGDALNFQIRINETEVVDLVLKANGDRLDGKFAGKDSGRGTIQATRMADIAGKWSGEWEIGPDGVPGPHYMVLKQDGGSVTGTAGPREDHQMEIRNGLVVEGRLQFEVMVPFGGPLIRFDFAVNGDAMQGQATMVNQGIEQKMKLGVKRIKP